MGEDAPPRAGTIAPPDFAFFSQIMKMRFAYVPQCLKNLIPSKMQSMKRDCLLIKGRKRNQQKMSITQTPNYLTLFAQTPLFS